MKKVIIFLLIVFLLTGCSVNENIKINKDLSVQESVSMFESSEFFNSRYKMLPINIIKEILYSRDRDKILNDNGYNFKIEQNAEFPYVVANKKYSSIEDFTNNTIFKTQYFNKVITTTNNNQISISASEFIKHDNQDVDYYNPDNLYINITIPYVVTSNNADKYDARTNTYTWIITNKTNDKEIKITFDKNRIYIYNLILYISIGILIILIGLLINYILKVKRKNKIMNRL